MTSGPPGIRLSAKRLRRVATRLHYTAGGPKRHPGRPHRPEAVASGHRGSAMIVVGVICLLVGLLVPVRFLWIFGSVLILVGAVLFIVSLTGHGRRYY